ncbi:MAG: acyl-CoA dehydratase activase-related protein [Coriobacteriales bacterium]
MTTVIGIPRALLAYRFGTLWSRFFEELGCRVVLSAPTDRVVLEEGEALSVDECCLASKIFMGHVASLQGRCDCVFVPSIAGEERRRGYCTKFESLPDLVASTFCSAMGRGELPLLSLRIDLEHPEREAFIELGQRLGAGKKEAKHAYKRAREAWEDERSERARAFDEQLRAALDARGSSSPARPLILFCAHPYVSQDPYLGLQAVEMLERCGAQVLFAHDFNPKKALEASEKFSTTMPWIVNRELTGAIACLRDKVDGVVIMSAFPCGPDSMTNEALTQRLSGVPSLLLTVDAQTGTAGLETRIESFVDILTFQSRGGYLHG